MIAALFVEQNGCYFELDNVDPWDKHRDARLYSGPYPVIAHPPCHFFGAQLGEVSEAVGGYVDEHSNAVSKAA